MTSFNLFIRAKECLHATEIVSKTELTKQLKIDWDLGKLLIDEPENWEDDFICGVPKELNLVPSSKLSMRKIDTKEGHGALIHAIVHIEFMAINLALDAVIRFRNMPVDFYEDWVRIADEERRHFELLAERLINIGYNYGDFAAHDGLWRTAIETADDIMVRMALVPRVLEARGLDVTPGIIKKLNSIGDSRSVDILEIIFKDEITHVESGSKWFKYLCSERGLNFIDTFKKIIETRFFGVPRGPFEVEARLAAGFSKEEIDYLQGL